MNTLRQPNLYSRAQHQGKALYTNSRGGRAGADFQRLPALLARGERVLRHEGRLVRRRRRQHLGLYPIVTSQYSSTTLYQFYCHVQ